MSRTASPCRTELRKGTLRAASAGFPVAGFPMTRPGSAPVTAVDGPLQDTSVWHPCMAPVHDIRA